MKNYNEYVFSKALKIAKWEDDYEIIGDFLWVHSRFILPHGATKMRKFFPDTLSFYLTVQMLGTAQREIISK